MTQLGSDRGLQGPEWPQKGSDCSFSISFFMQSRTSRTRGTGSSDMEIAGGSLKMSKKIHTEKKNRKKREKDRISLVAKYLHIFKNWRDKLMGKKSKSAKYSGTFSSSRGICRLEQHLSVFSSHPVTWYLAEEMILTFSSSFCPVSPLSSKKSWRLITPPSYRNSAFRCQVTGRKMTLVTVEHKKQSQGVSFCTSVNTGLYKMSPSQVCSWNSVWKQLEKICGLHGDSHHGNAL